MSAAVSVHFEISCCPSCGSADLRPVRATWKGNYKGRKYLVPGLSYYECPRCGEKVYDPAAMRQLETASPAFARRRGIGK
jgi:YgiT-type zinc finger domain-containing protein